VLCVPKCSMETPLGGFFFSGEFLKCSVCDIVKEKIWNKKK
jgi:hypothetical protein